MPAENVGGEAPGRKHKAHRKSRFGCANCKVRGIKCDEVKPSCRQCETYGVICPFGTNYPLNTLSTVATFKVDLAPRLIRSPTVPLPILSSLTSSETYQLIPEDAALVDLFQRRSAVTLGSSTSRHIYVDKTLRIAFSHPFVLHAVLALAHLHNLAFDTSTAAKDARQLSRHWHSAVSLLNRRLIQPVIPTERDAIWLSATLISIAGFSATGSDTPDEAWPLRSPSVLDLSWLRLCNGKRHVAELTDSLREDSEFRQVTTELLEALNQLEGITAVPRNSWDGLPSGFFELLELFQDPTDNPYYQAIVGLLDLDHLNPFSCQGFGSIAAGVSGNASNFPFW